MSGVCLQVAEQHIPSMAEFLTDVVDLRDVSDTASIHGTLHVACLSVLNLYQFQKLTPH